MANQRLPYALHSWSGLFAAWLLFAVCLTGTLVVYKFPLKALANPTLVAGPASDRIGPDGALAAFRAAYPAPRPNVVAFPSDIYSIHQYSVLAEGPDGDERRYWIDPETGQVRDQLNSDFADFILRLHANLFLGQPGRWLVGVLGVWMVFSLGVGLWFHWRRLRRDLFNLRLGDHARKAWGDLHKALGVWAFPFHLIIALTGAWLGLESLIGIRASDSSPIEVAGSGIGTPRPIAEIVRSAVTLRPDFTPSHVNMTNYGTAGATIRVQGDLPGHRFVQRGQTMLVFDADSGRHLQTIDRTGQGLGRRILAMVRPLHYGYFWPFWSELLYFALGAASTLLAMSGILIWAEREKRKLRRASGDRTATRMERANAGVMGGLIAALAAMALLNGAARLSSVGGGRLDFMGGQDMLAGRPLAPELLLFLAIWALAALLLASLQPLRAWAAAVIATGVALVALPVLGAIEAASPAVFATRGGGEAIGYALACFLLALLGALIVRRLARRPMQQDFRSCQNTA